jgi:hypothetical protein
MILNNHTMKNEVISSGKLSLVTNKTARADKQSKHNIIRPLWNNSELEQTQRIPEELVGYSCYSIGAQL